MKKLNDFIKEYGDYIVKDGFMDFLEKPRPKTIWDLKDGDKYFYISMTGGVYESTWHNNDFDIKARRQGNVFLTKEKAEYEVRRREVYSTVKRYAYEFSDDEWNNFNMRKYYLYYDYRKYFIDEGVNCRCRHGELYFKSEADIDRAIAAVGEEYFKKYYLGVKE